jgi:hypothetical protein
MDVYGRSHGNAQLSGNDQYTHRSDEIGAGANLPLPLCLPRSAASAAFCAVMSA